MESYVTIRDNMGPYRTIRDHTGPYGTIQYPFWYTEPSRRGKKALGNGSAALLRLMYGPVHFQGPARDEQF